MRWMLAAGPLSTDRPHWRGSRLVSTSIRLRARSNGTVPAGLLRRRACDAHADTNHSGRNVNNVSSAPVSDVFSRAVHY